MRCKYNHEILCSFGRKCYKECRFLLEDKALKQYLEAPRGKYKCLDLYCGLGGWSIGFDKEGFEVLGVEIVPKIAELYPFKCIVKDVRELNVNNFKDFHVIVGSPPCRDFSQIGDFLGHTWKRPPDPEGEGLSMVNAFLKIVREVEPKFWLMENVKQLQKYIGKAKFCSYLGTKRMYRCFWGEFPYFFIIRDSSKRIYTGHENGKRPTMSGKGGALKSWKSAKIPLSISRALAHAIKRELDKCHTTGNMERSLLR